jgi:serine protease Do
MSAFKAAKRTSVLMLFCLLTFAAAASAAGPRGYLGVTLQDISESMAKALQIEGQGGVLVNDVRDDSPAAKAGLQAGDVILGIDNEIVKNAGELTALVGGKAPGDEVDVLIRRDGKEFAQKVELGEREDAIAVFKGDAGDFHKQMMKTHKMPEGAHWFGEGDHKVMVMPKGGHRQIWIGDGDELTELSLNADRGFLGVHLDDIEGQMGAFFGVEDNAGALVTSVEDDSPAAKAGLKAGDVVVGLDDAVIASPDDLYKAMAGTEPGQKAKVKVVRKGDDKSFDVTLGEMPEDVLAGGFEFFGEDGENIVIRTPRTMRFHGAPDADVEVEVFERHHPRVEIHRMHEDGGEVEELRGELDALRKELQELRNELKK